MKGYRTIAVGLATAVLPVAITYLLGVDWTKAIGPNAALIVSGLLTVAMRFVTTTPPGQAK
jgi:hypothetical protein